MAIFLLKSCVDDIHALISSRFFDGSIGIIDFSAEVFGLPPVNGYQLRCLPPKSDCMFHLKKMVMS